LPLVLPAAMARISNEVGDGGRVHFSTSGIWGGGASTTQMEERNLVVIGLRRDSSRKRTAESRPARGKERCVLKRAEDSQKKKPIYPKPAWPCYMRLAPSAQSVQTNSIRGYYWLLGRKQWGDHERERKVSVLLPPTAAPRVRCAVGEENSPANKRKNISNHPARKQGGGKCKKEKRACARFDLARQRKAATIGCRATSIVRGRTVFRGLASEGERMHFFGEGKRPTAAEGCVIRFLRLRRKKSDTRGGRPCISRAKKGGRGVRGRLQKNNGTKTVACSKVRA